MKISRVQATWCRVPIPEERRFTSDFGLVSTFDSVIVRIDTACGLTGWGEAKAGVGSAAACAGLAAIINLDYAPLLVGLGVRELSMAGTALPRVKQRIRRLAAGPATQRARAIMDQVDEVRIATLLDDFNEGL